MKAKQMLNMLIREEEEVEEAGFYVAEELYRWERGLQRWTSSRKAKL